MAEEQNPRVGEKSLPVLTSMNDVKYIRTLNQTDDSTIMGRDDFVLPASQVNGIPSDVQTELDNIDNELSTLSARLTYESGFYYINL